MSAVAEQAPDVAPGGMPGAATDAAQCGAGAAAEATEVVDLLVIGGGIVGAGVLREAARCGLRALLVEQHDFASGTSSRSSKLVHGGLQYLGRMELRLAWETLRERARVVSGGTGLVESMPFLLSTYRRGHRPAPWQAAALLLAYELLGGRLRAPLRHAGRRDGVGGDHPAARTMFDGALAGLAADDLFEYGEATTDDAGLVLRVLREGVALGGSARNYTECTGLVRDARRRVIGARLLCRATGAASVVRARVVVNAAGAWADRLPHELGVAPRVRGVRGSHLVIPRARLPLRVAVAGLNRATGQPLYLIPWQGVTLVGSTSVEHDGDPARAVTTPDELGVLLEGVNALFPALRLTARDVQATLAGVRPLVGCATGDPSRASREFRIWNDGGMITVLGGKLTSFQSGARRVMAHVLTAFPGASVTDAAPLDGPQLPLGLPLDVRTATRLAARYGAAGVRAIAAMPARDHEPVHGTGTLWGELRWAARAEGVRHLEDLLLRRVRVGLTAPQGGRMILTRLRPLLEQELGWDATHCRLEEQAYVAVWRRQHGVPTG
jgi:glycerol-3-phosphate dehydrogenase